MGVTGLKFMTEKIFTMYFKNHIKIAKVRHLARLFHSPGSAIK